MIDFVVDLFFWGISYATPQPYTCVTFNVPAFDIVLTSKKFPFTKWWLN